jgi:hypothetical protein
MRYRLMATYRGVPYEAGVGPTNSDVVLFAACPPPEALGFEPATGHWRKQVIRAEIDALWESRPVGVFRGQPCIVLDDLGDRLHVAYLGTDADRARQLGFWQVDRGVYEVLTPRDEVTGLTEERVDRPLRWSEHPGSSPARTAYPYGTAPWPSLVTPAPAPSSAPAPVPPPEAAAPGPSPASPAGPAGPVTGPASAAVTGPASAAVTGPASAAPPAADPYSPAFPADLHSSALPAGLPSPSVPADPYLAEPGAQPLPALSPAGTAEPAGAGLPMRPAPAGPAGPPMAGLAGPATAGPPPAVPPLDEPLPAALPLDGPLPAGPAPGGPAEPVSGGPAGSSRYPANGAWPTPDSGPGTAFPPPAANGLPAAGGLPAMDYPGHAYPGAPDGPSGGDPGGRAGRRQRVPTRELFCELADLASIPRSAYALETETDGAMCLLPTPAGFEVFIAAGGARHEVRTFAEEETAYFYLFGVLAAEAIRNGALAPAVARAGLRQAGG